MKPFIVFIFLLISIISDAQYESIFGQNSTQWDFQWNNLFGSFQDTIYTDKDTIVQGHIWKKILCYSCQGVYKGGLIREDTTIGKVWYKALPDNSFSVDTNTQLIFDFALQIGDSFDISGAWGINNTPNTYRIVDSVYYINNLKYISFNYDGYSIPFFIESIGSIVGIVYKQEPTLMRDQSLLCVYKDNVSSYDNPYHPCMVISTINQANNSPIFKILPSPFQEKISVVSPSFEDIKSIKIYNIQGILTYSSNNPQHEIMLNVPSGLYFIQIKTIHNTIITQKLIKQ